MILSVRILLFAAAVPLLFRLRLDRVASLLEPRRRAPRETVDIDALVDRVDAALARGRPLVSRSCLTRAATLYRFLRLAGEDVTLTFGVGQIGGGFTGHCWIVKNGEPYAEREDPRTLFVETYTIPAPR